MAFCSQNASVEKTIYSKQAQILRQHLIAMRKKAGLTQRQLAERLNREHNLIGRLELGERRLDVIEFYWICAACSVDAGKAAKKLMDAFSKIE